MKKAFIIKIAVLYTFSAFLLLGFPTMSKPQSTIIYMPSNDFVGERAVGLRFTGSFKINDEKGKKRFSSFVPRVIFGVGKNVEVGLNFTGNVQPGNDATTIVPTVKWRLYFNEKQSVAIVAGTNVFLPVRNRKYNAGSYTYLQTSRYFKATRTRLTGGAYFYTKNVVAANAHRGGGQFGIEQTVNKRVLLTAEWITGRHSSGYFTPGLKLKINKRALAYFAYPISNQNPLAGNHFFLAGLAYRFNY